MIYNSRRERQTLMKHRYQDQIARCTKEKDSGHSPHLRLLRRGRPRPSNYHQKNVKITLKMLIDCLSVCSCVKHLMQIKDHIKLTNAPTGGWAKSHPPPRGMTTGHTFNNRCTCSARTNCASHSGKARNHRCTCSARTNCALHSGKAHNHRCAAALGPTTPRVGVIEEGIR